MDLYRALYRKYRPADFSDVYGQPHIVRTLKNQIAEGRLSHAYLFTGSRGTGKTSCAKILAKAVNCLSPDNGNPCNKCEICRAANNDTLFDITEIDAASNNGVDDIRELRDNTAYTPALAKYRVFIIDEVHMLSTPAFNALLKTLEEPPEHVIFILATTEVHKLPATILSRCQRFDFRRIQDKDISARLIQVSKLENIDITDGGAGMIAKLSDGALRDALSLLDVCSADGTPVDEKKVLDVAGLSGREYLFNISEAISDRNTKTALEIIDELYKRAKDLSLLCSELVSYFRDIMMVKLLDNDAKKYIFASDDELAHIKDLANMLPAEKIMHAVDVFDGALLRINRGSDRRTAVERAVITLCEPSLDISTSALLSRIESLEKRNDFTAHVPELENNEKKTCEPDAPAISPQPCHETDGSEDTKFERWGEVLAQLSKTDIMLKAVLKGSKAYIKDDLILIDIANGSFRDMINGESRHRTLLKQAIFSVTGQRYRIGPYTRTEKGGVQSDPLDSLIENARNNGLVGERKI